MLGGLPAPPTPEHIEYKKPVAVAITCELLDLFNMFNEFISYGKNGIIRGENGMNQDPLLKR